MIGWSLGPRVTKKDGKLVARTSIPSRLLNLGLDSKIVVVDPGPCTIEVRHRILWFVVKERTIRFDQIKRIDYSHSDANIFTALGAAGDSIDRFSVRLELRAGGTVHLFDWVGDGPFTSGGYPEWVHWKELRFDTLGSQARQSKVFVTILSELTGAPLI